MGPSGTGPGVGPVLPVGVTGWDLGSSRHLRIDFKANGNEIQAKWGLLKIHSKPGAGQAGETVAPNSWVICFLGGFYFFKNFLY